MEAGDAAPLFREEFAAGDLGWIEAGLLRSGQFVDIRQATGTGGGAMEEERAVFLAPHTSDGALFNLLGGEPGKPLRVAAIGGCTERAHRAREAQRIVAEADGRTQLHHGLIVVAGSIGGKERLGQRGEIFRGAGLVAKLGGVGGEAGEDADDVAIDTRGGGAEGDARDRG